MVSTNMRFLADRTGPVVPKVLKKLESSERALKATELATILGVTRQHVYKMAAQGTIPSFRIGAAVRFDPGLIAEWLRRKMPRQIIAPEAQRMAV